MASETHDLQLPYQPKLVLIAPTHTGMATVLVQRFDVFGRRL